MRQCGVCQCVKLATQCRERLVQNADAADDDDDGDGVDHDGYNDVDGAAALHVNDDPIMAI